MNNLCFILPYFGEEPFWFKYFIKSVAKNGQYKLFLFTDFDLKNLPVNIAHYKLSLIEFNQLVSKQLNIRTNIVDPYKICDFKPAFGQIFRKFIKDFDFWAYCDADIILGNIDKFLSELLKREYDIISPDKDFFPGHFCVFRNNERINKLYQKAKNHQSVFESAKNYYFDEFFIKHGLTSVQQRNKVIRKVYLKKRIVKGVKFFFPKIRRERKIFDRENELLDFNNVINYFSSQGKIQVFQDRLYESDFTFKVDGLTKWSVRYEDGHVYNGKMELLYFHFQLSKGLNNFYIIEKGEKKFTLKVE